MKRIVFIVSVTVAAAFILVSLHRWGKLINEEYFYDNSKHLYRKLKEFPSNLNIENVKRIKASVDPSRFKFVVMGDSRGNDEVMEKVVKAALLHKPDFIIFLGDLTEQGKLRHHKKEMDFVKRHIPVPFIFVIGNHDYYNNGYTAYTHIYGPADFYFDIGKYRFICLDNNSKEKPGEIEHLPDTRIAPRKRRARSSFNTRTLVSLASLLEDESHTNLIFMHHPAPLKGWRSRSATNGSEEFLELIKRFSSRVPHVSASHMHGYGFKELYGIKFHITAGAGAKWHLAEAENIIHRYNYVLFEVDESGVKDRVFFVDG